MTEKNNTPKEVEKKEIESKMLDLTRVERMTSGGRRLRFRVVMVVGDRNGNVGVATAKATDVSGVIEKTTKLAKKKMIKVPIVDGTIPHQVEANFGSAKILLRPQKKGRGLIAGGTVKIICDLAGIEDISGKIIGRSNNKLNNAKAVIAAFQKLKNNKKEEILKKD
jgi:small subunit ribosomal protein S5